MAYNFERLDSPHNIYFEIGSEDLAQYVNKTIDKLIVDVEKEQFKSFNSVDEIKVFVFSNKERYSNYSQASDKTRGSAMTNEIYISPIIRGRVETLPSILTHELSHINIRQYIGSWNYINYIPGWFLEGLAV